MRNKHVFGIGSCIKIKGGVSSKTGLSSPSSFPTDCSKVVFSVAVLHCLCVCVFISGLCILCISLQKRNAHSNVLKISPPKTESFQIRIL